MPEPHRIMTPTPSQTVGPFFGYALPFPGGQHVVPVGSPEAIRIHGTVSDGAGDPVPDALIETWQGDAAGCRISVRGTLARDPHLNTGFGRAATDRSGHWSVITTKPGPANASSAPYVLVTVFARGLLRHLMTRLYFADEGELNAADRLLSRVDAGRRDTLIAAIDPNGGYRFDIRLQGAQETVFLEFDDAFDRRADD